MSGPPNTDADLHGAAVVEARLGREARDVLEATVVLEAWAGRPARRAMASARSLVNLNAPSVRALSRMDPFQEAEQVSVIAEGITLVLLIVSIAAWATPIRRHLGPNVLSHAIHVALPIAVAMQWGLRSRYLGRPQGLACLARDGLGAWAAILVVVDLPLVFMSPWGPVAAMLVPIWVGGAILTRRGWGPVYAAVLVVATIALTRNLAPDGVLGVLTGITLVMCHAAVATRRKKRTDLRAGTVNRAVMAAQIGAVLGVMLVADPSLGWGVHGAHPAVALVPSVIGSYWGGYYLWNFYEAVPRGLRGVSLQLAGGVALSDPAMSIFIGAVGRLLLATAVLSALVTALAPLLNGTDAVTVFIAFGGVGTASMLIGMLEAFSLQVAALVAATAGLAAEIGWTTFMPAHAPGAALAVGAGVAVLVTLPPLLGRLAQSGRVLATTLWIQ